MDGRGVQERGTARVMVEVDESPGSLAALAWALRAAEAREAVLVVVTTLPADFARDDADARDARGGAVRWEAVRRMQELVADALAGLAVSGVQVPSIQFAVVPGEPAAQLLDRSRAADLLVLGRPGYDTRAVR